MGNWINFQEIRARVSIEDVLLKYYQITTLTRDGNKLLGACPSITVIVPEPSMPT